MNGTIILIVTIGIVALIVIGIVAAIVSFYKKPKMGQAIIRTGMGGTQVAINQGIMVVPVLQKMEVMNTAMTMIHTNFMDENALITKDHKKVNTKLSFVLRVNLEISDILIAAGTIGSERSFNGKALNKIFSGKFIETVKTVSKNLTFEEMQNHDNFKLRILQNLGLDLNGYIVDDCIIDYLKENKPQNTDSITV